MSLGVALATYPFFNEMERRSTKFIGVFRERTEIFLPLSSYSKKLNSSEPKAVLKDGSGKVTGIYTLKEINALLDGPTTVGGKLLRGWRNALRAAQIKGPDPDLDLPALREELENARATLQSVHAKLEDGSIKLNDLSIVRNVQMQPVAGFNKLFGTRFSIIRDDARIGPKNPGRPLKHQASKFDGKNL